MNDARGSIDVDNESLRGREGVECLEGREKGEESVTEIQVKLMLDEGVAH